jgi:hypothetical protein
MAAQTPAALGVTCREAFGVFAQYETLALQRRVRALERENYLLRRPSLYTCMRQFNHAEGPCFCVCCAAGGRATTRDARYVAWAAARTTAGLGLREPCEFQPRWEVLSRSCELVCEPVCVHSNLSCH